MRTDLSTSWFSLTQIALHRVSPLDIEKDGSMGTVIHTDPTANTQEGVNSHHTSLPYGDGSRGTTFGTKCFRTLDTDQLVNGRITAESPSELILQILHLG